MVWQKHVRLLIRQVWVYTVTSVCVGEVHTYPRLRLLDLLNGRVAGGSHREYRIFLPLTNAAIRPREGGEASRCPFIAINKGDILFVGEGASSPGEPVPESFSQLVYKWPFWVRMYLPADVLLLGQLHCAHTQRVLDVLNTEDRFLPLTQVSTSPPLERESPIPFLAVNKERILRLEEA